MQGIKFNQQGIEGIKSGVKTMTRRPIKVRTDITKQAWIDTLISDYCKYKVGETVFVQEEFRDTLNVLYYKAGYEVQGDMFALSVWKPASEMKEHQARFFLKIKSIKVERLQDIYHNDIMSEGMNYNTYEPKQTAKLYGDDVHGEVDWCEDIALEWWIEIWNNLPYKAPYDWNSNPYVFAYEFERVENETI